MERHSRNYTLWIIWFSPWTIPTQISETNQKKMKWYRGCLRNISHSFVVFPDVFPKMISPIIMYPWVLLWIQCVRCFHVSPARRSLSAEHVNDHPRWTASLPLRAACDCSKWERGRGQKTDRKERQSVACQGKRRSLDSFPFHITALQAFDKQGRVGGGQVQQ